MRRLPLPFADVISLSLVSACILTATLPIITTGDRIHLDADFLQLAGRREDVRRGIIDFHTLPQRSPWFGGGYPTLGDPEHPTLNPLIVLCVLLGTVAGIKWTGILMMLFAGSTLYLLCRRKLGFGHWPAIGTALFFALSPWSPVRLRDGNPTEIYYLLLPACIWCLRAADGRKRYLFLLALMFFTALSDGKAILPAMLLYLALLCAATTVPGIGMSPKEFGRSGSRLAKRLALAVALTFFLGLFRIVPAVNLIQDRASLWQMDLYTHSDSYFSIYGALKLVREPVGWDGEDGLDGQQTSIYVGWIPVLLGGLGLALSPRRCAVWAIAALPMVFLGMGSHAPVDVFQILFPLPLFNGISNVGKYFLPPVLFSGCVIAGLGIQGLERYIRAGRYLVPVIVCVGVAVLWVKVWSVSATSYPDPVPAIAAEPANGFYQVRGDGLVRDRAEPPEANMYINLMRGVGTIDWYTAVPLTEDAVSARYLVTQSGDSRPNPGYRGEVYWAAGTGEVRSWKFEPNRITALVASNQPGELVFNQNYDEDWSTNVGVLHNRDGLLAVTLPAGEHDLQLRYFSSAFGVGLLLSLLSAAAVGAVVVAYITGGLERSRGAVARSILWWIE